MPILQYRRNTSGKIWEIQIFCSPSLSVMPEVGQCLFTGKAISPRQTTICRPAPSQQQCNLPTAQAGGKKRRQLFVTWLINWQHRVTRRSTIRGRQAALCKRMKDTLTAGDKGKTKTFPIKLSWEKQFQLSYRGDESKCLLCGTHTCPVFKKMKVGISQKSLLGLPLPVPGSRTLIPAISSCVKASTPWL